MKYVITVSFELNTEDENSAKMAMRNFMTRACSATDHVPNFLGFHLLSGEVKIVIAEEICS